MAKSLAEELSAKVGVGEISVEPGLSFRDEMASMQAFTPAPAPPSPPETSSFLGNLWDSFKRGVRTTEESAAVAGMLGGVYSKAEAAQAIAGLKMERGVEVPEPLARLYGELVEEAKDLDDAIARGNLFSQVIEGVDFFGSVVWQAIKNPKGTALLMSESLGTSIAPAVGGLAGAVGLGLATKSPLGGLLGYTSGSAAGTFALELGVEYNKQLKEMGVDLTDEDAIRQAMQDEKFHRTALEMGARRGLGVAAADAVFNMFLGKFTLGGTGSLARRIITGAAGVGLQATGEAVGEAAGELAKGEAPSAVEMGLEFLGGMGVGGVEVAGMTLAQELGGTRPGMVPPEVVVQGPPALPPSLELDVVEQEIPLASEALREERRQLEEELVGMFPEEADTIPAVKAKMDAARAEMFETDAGSDVLNLVDNQKVGASSNPDLVGRDVRDMAPGEVAAIGATKMNKALESAVEALSELEGRLLGDTKVVLADKTVAPWSGLIERGLMFSKVVDDKMDTVYLMADTSLPSNEVLDLWAHEIGHAVTIKNFIEAPAEVQEALTREWFNEIHEAKKFDEVPFTDRFQQLLTPVEVATLDPELARFTAGHSLSFLEFLAQQFAKTQAQRVKEGQLKGKTPVMKEWLKEATDTLESVHGKLDEAFETFPAFNKWMQIIRTDTKIADLQRAEERKRSELDEPVARVEKLKKSGILTTEESDGLKDVLVRYNEFYRQALTLLQVEKLNKDVPGVSKYVDTVRAKESLRKQFTAEAAEIAREWVRGIPGKRQDQFAKFLYEVTALSDKRKERLGDDSTEMKGLVRKYNLTGLEWKLYKRIDGQFQKVLNTLEQIEMDEARRLHVGNVVALNASLKEISDRYKGLRNRNYFPYPRFGTYSIVVRAKKAVTYEGKAFRTGDVVVFDTRETESDRNQAWALLKKDFADRSSYNVHLGVIDEELTSFIGLPTELLEFFKKHMNLTAKQSDTLDEFTLKYSPTRSFSKHLLKRKSIKGYSEDAFRAYSDYMSKASSHIARSAYHHQFLDAMDMVKRAGTEQSEKKTGVHIVRERPDDLTALGKLHNHLKRHYDYMSGARAEFQRLRAVAVHWYLGFNLKSAIVNSTQVPHVTYPRLAADHGDVVALREIAKAYKDLSVERNLSKISVDEKAAFDWGVVHAGLDESIGSELAGFSEGSNLIRASGMTISRHYLNRLEMASMYMFQMVEKLNRRVAFLSAYRLGKQKGVADPLTYARDIVADTQFEYEWWNRPEITRGRKGIFFVFQLHTQNMLFNLLGGMPGTGRLWLTTLLAGGLLGLPFIENGVDIADWLATKYKERLGWKNPKVQLRRELKNWVKDLAVGPPDLYMHGMGRYMFGLFDVSASLSMGEILPGTSMLGREGDADRAFRTMTGEFGGAAISIPINFLRAAYDSKNLDSLKRWETAMPSAMKSLSRAYRWAESGEERRRDLSTQVTFDITDPWEASEVLGQAFSLRPRRVAQIQEQDILDMDLLRYYRTRKEMLRKQHDYVLEMKDREAEADVWRAIQKYNNAVPDPGLRLTGAELRQSLQRRARNRFLREMGFGPNKREWSLQIELQRERGREEEGTFIDTR